MDVDGSGTAAAVSPPAAGQPQARHVFPFVYFFRAEWARDLISIFDLGAQAYVLRRPTALRSTKNHRITFYEEPEHAMECCRAESRIVVNNLRMLAAHDK